MSIKFCGTTGMTVLMAAISMGLVLSIEEVAASNHNLSDRYSMIVDPLAKQQLGEETFNEVMKFFNNAELAIENKDLEALMVLYSDNYSDGEHNKQSARMIWQRIFSTFDSMATHHNMKLVNYSTDKNLIILRCSGLLLGVPDVEKGVITIDSWNQQDHMLVREDGIWKLIGSYGKEHKRLWFDKPMHPLF